MAEKLKLTALTGDYEIVRALKEGKVEADGIELEFPDPKNARNIHVKMARGEFDIGEFNAGAYMAAKFQGRDFTALPIFLHRRFRHGFVFINKNAGIDKPTDLIGKKIGSTNFQPAGNLWIRGILENDYDVPHKSISWFTDRDEDIAFDYPDDLRIQRISSNQDLDDMLATGELDAMLSPNIPVPIQNLDPRVGHLWENYKDIEIDYYHDTGVFPIMHVTIIRQEIVEDHPWVVKSLMDAFNEAKRLAFERLVNPRIVPLAFYRSAWDEQRALLGDDPWEYGLSEINRKNLEILIKFVHQQGLTGRRMNIDELFVPEV